MLSSYYRPMRKVYFILTTITIITICGCVHFKGGDYYNHDPKSNSVLQYYFHNDGKYECYFQTEGSRHLSEKGTWKEINSKIEVQIDSSYSQWHVATKLGTQVVYRKRLFSDKRLTSKVTINGQQFTSIIYKVESSN